MRVYLSGPMDGCTEEEAGEWRKEAARSLRFHGITTLSPMDREYRKADFEHDPESVLPDLVEEDKIDIEMSDVVLVNYTQTSVGTSMEIILAWQRAKRVIIVAPKDMSLSPWVIYHSHNIFHTMDEAIEHIVEFNNRIR